MPVSICVLFLLVPQQEQQQQQQKKKKKKKKKPAKNVESRGDVQKNGDTVNRKGASL